MDNNLIYKLSFYIKFVRIINMPENDSHKHYAGIINKLVGLIFVLTIALGISLLFIVNIRLWFIIQLHSN